jgi:hypothetical protein
VLRRKHGPKRDEVTRAQITRSCMICTAHRLFRLSNKNEMGGHMECMRDKIGGNRVLVGRPNGKRPLGNPRRTYEDNMELINACWALRQKSDTANNF